MSHAVDDEEDETKEDEAGDDPARGSGFRFRPFVSQNPDHEGDAGGEGGYAYAMGLVRIGAEGVAEDRAGDHEGVLPGGFLLLAKTAWGKGCEAVGLYFGDAGAVVVEEAGNVDAGLAGHGDKGDAAVRHGDEAFDIGPGEELGALAHGAGDASVRDADDAA